MECKREKLGTKKIVFSPLGLEVRMYAVYMNCSIMLSGIAFPYNLIEMLFKVYDIILGMDWLSKYQARVDCRKKIIECREPEYQGLKIQGCKPSAGFFLISATIARKLLRQGCTAYLACVMDTQVDTQILGYIGSI